MPPGLRARPGFRHEKHEGKKETKQVIWVYIIEVFLFFPRVQTFLWPLYPHDEEQPQPQRSFSFVLPPLRISYKLYNSILAQPSYNHDGAAPLLLALALQIYLRNQHAYINRSPSKPSQSLASLSTRWCCILKLHH